MSNFYSFSAIRGMQAGHPYYTVMIPLCQVPRIFSFDDETLPPDLRTQRVLSKGSGSPDRRLPVDELGQLHSLVTLRVGGWRPEFQAGVR